MPKANYKPGPTGWKLKVEIYRGTTLKKKPLPWASNAMKVTRKWYWHAIAKNGRIVADSGQGYTRKSNCLTGWLGITDVVLAAAGHRNYPHRYKLVWEEKNRTSIWY